MSGCFRQVSWRWSPDPGEQSATRWGGRERAGWVARRGGGVKAGAVAQAAFSVRDCGVPIPSLASTRRPLGSSRSGTFRSDA